MRRRQATTRVLIGARMRRLAYARVDTAPRDDFARPIFEMQCYGHKRAPRVMRVADISFFRGWTMPISVAREDMDKIGHERRGLQHA